MKPSGSITKYYDFLSANTLAIVERVVELASSYEQAVELLCDEAAEENATEDLLFLALNLSINNKQVQRILSVHPEMVGADLYRLEYELTQGYRNDWDTLLSLYQDIIEEDLESWIEFQFYTSLWRISLSFSIASPQEEESIENMRRLIVQDERLKPFESTLIQMQAYRYRAEGAEEEAIEEFKKALEIAEKYDDNILAASLHYSIAWGIRNFDTSVALMHYEKACALHPEGYKGPMVSIHNIRGEFDISLDFYHDAIAIIDKKHTNPHYGSLSQILSILYNEVGRHEDALEWARMSLDKGHFSGVDPAAHSSRLWLACSLANLNRIEEAEEEFNISKERFLKTGAEIHIAETHYATGIIERAKGNLEDAVWSISQALAIYERISRQVRVNKCLRVLAELEVDLYQPDEGEAETLWLSSLEETARAQDYPGYLGFALLIKAKLRLKQDRIADASAILDELVAISQRAGTRFLQPLIEGLVEEPRLDETI
ncbi:MAG: hypothetical protein ACXADF_12115 [Candidatus Thorarchaeota archaeon]